MRIGFFEDNNSSNYYLYQLTSTRAEGDGDNNEDATAPAYTIKGQQLENFTPSSPSTVLYNTWFSTAFVFYAEGADVDIAHDEAYYERIAKTIEYKPETSWNYEVGAHLNLLNNQLHLDLAAYDKNSKYKENYITRGAS